MKFKVGDKVRVREWADMEKEFGLDCSGDIKCRYCFTRSMREYCGKVFEIKRAGPEYRIDNLVWAFSDDMLEPVCDSKIVITTDGKTTLVRLYEDGEVKKSAKAECTPDDKFDFSVGAKLAFERLTKPEPKYYCGKVVCVEKKHDNYAYTVGKIYEFKNGRVKIDNGNEAPCATRVTSLDEWNASDWAMAKFIELKE